MKFDGKATLYIDGRPVGLFKNLRYHLDVSVKDCPRCGKPMYTAVATSEQECSNSQCRWRPTAARRT